MITNFLFDEVAFLKKKKKKRYKGTTELDQIIYVEYTPK